MDSKYVVLRHYANRDSNAKIPLETEVIALTETLFLAEALVTRTLGVEDFVCIAHPFLGDTREYYRIKDYPCNEGIKEYCTVEKKEVIGCMADI